MAFPAEIELRLKTEALDRQLRAVERQIGDLSANNKIVPQGLLAAYDTINKDLDEATAEVIKRGQRETVNTRELKKQTNELRKQKATRKRGFQSAALGVGFPLLFGGGAGSIAGGLLGSAGGFGGQILGSAIGSQLDKAVQQITKTSQVVASTGDSFDFLSENALYSSDETKKLAEELAELGKVEELAALNTKELVTLIGNKSTLR